MWTEKLSASDKSSYIYNQEMCLEEPGEELERRVCEPLKDTGRVDGRRGKRRRWRILWRIVAERLKGRMIMLGETLAEKLNEAVCCRVCQPDADLPRKRKLQSKKEVYCYPTACICNRTGVLS